MLTKLEANWIYLERQLMNYVNIHQPTLKLNVEAWLELIRPLPIVEKTLYLAQLSEPLFSELTTAKEKTDWQDVKKLLIKENQVRDVHVLNIFEKTIDDWIHIVRKEAE
ncbi:hypothetical protein JMM81_07340 [Bacillus sp. V3B]|uniref:hypothetical protein n=1 Tax=Bacillus sp. V3B TaxID=2804915 RepID=UPI00210C2EC3|nr:hypothetical protein [Bacillus sp. V3B]MCQ6274783.1 hypothetical protein [Bacillus sp. V3B]